MTVVGVDLGLTEELAAEHLLHRLRGMLGGDGWWICTHRVDGGLALAVAHPDLGGHDARGRVDAAVSQVADSAAVVTGDDGSAPEGDAWQRARQAVDRFCTRTEGRAVVFPGSEDLTGTVTVTQVLASAIEQVRSLGAEQPRPVDLVHTRNFVRPRFEAGRLVLHVQPAAGGFEPFEQPEPHRCCQDH